MEVKILASDDQCEEPLPLPQPLEPSVKLTPLVEEEKVHLSNPNLQEADLKEKHPLLDHTSESNDLVEEVKIPLSSHNLSEGQSLESASKVKNLEDKSSHSSPSLSDDQCEEPLPLPQPLDSPSKLTILVGEDKSHQFNPSLSEKESEEHPPISEETKSNSKPTLLVQAVKTLLSGHSHSEDQNKELPLTERLEPTDLAEESKNSVLNPDLSEIKSEDPPALSHSLDSPSKFAIFSEKVKNRISTPKESPTKTKSKVLDHLKKPLPEKYKLLIEASHKIGAKHISQLRYYKETPKISEDIALCYLLLLDLPIPKSHYWEQFVLFLSRPGMFLQLLRHLPFYLESECKPLTLAKVFQVFSKIPKKDFALDSRFFELQLLLNILEELMKIAEIPEMPEKIVRKVKIPASAKASCRKEFFCEQEVLESYDVGVLKDAVEFEAKQLRVLNGQLQREVWNEKRWIKNEERLEMQRETEREIDIKRNTDSEFFKKLDKANKERQIIDSGFKCLAVSELRSIKKSQKKQELIEISKAAHENYASMVWDKQLAKAKEMQYRTDTQTLTKMNLEDRRDYFKLEQETIKADQALERTETKTSSLKQQYKSLLKEKAKILKALKLYSDN